MSGFGAVFAAVVFFVIFTVAISSISELSTSSVQLLSSVQSPGPVSDPVMGSSLVSGSGVILVNVTLQGSVQIRFSDLKLADLFAVYDSNGSRVTERLVFGSQEPPCWQVENVFQGNLEGSMVDPINVTQGTGIWLPGETLELELNVSQAIDNQTGWYLAMTLNDGGSCSGAFG
jgi:hypothetical protein